ncbi:protocadherin beta-15-like isoform X1 [Octopus vulgaris]|uniref:Protocadherin beta-15-like isoform X1 n=1 Tax=Octopus vulgaris TaxID=6645 RepID=A0AA36BFH7_OCTVU|nr:protocadherin beta-15-like isoform X1 [Octopus vulgaris]
MTYHPYILEIFVKNMFVQALVHIFLLHVCECIDFTYYVEEGKDPGFYLGDIRSDTHLMNSIPIKDHYLIKFNQLQQHVTDKRQLFNVTKTGKLYTAQTLDAESFCKYNTECFEMVDIAVQKRESFIKILEIKVIIKDINDNSPKFPTDEINLEFSEGDKKGSKRSIANAIDRDVGIFNSKIIYHLEKKENEPFELAVYKRVDGSNNLQIILEKEIDREIKDNYVIRVIAKDGGMPSLQGILTVHISVTDINDNPPIFSQNIYNITINNGYHRGESVIVLTATDLDTDNNGKISYHFSSKTTDLTKSHFDLDESTGEIFFHGKSTSGKRVTYKLFIEAKDGGFPPLSSIVMVRVNVINQQNNAPEVDIKFVTESTGNTVTISERAEVGSFIAFVKVIDNDTGQNGQVSCDLQHEKLQLQSFGQKKYKVVVKNSVDRETENQTDFTITCEDKGSPPLKTQRRFSIQVMDVNDVQPKFSKDSFKFLTYENEKPYFPVGLINTIDPDLGPGGQLTYSLLTQRYTLPFEISNFGFILTTKSLDREQQDIYKFRVFVKDNGIPSLNNTANVIIEVMDKNDNAPYFIFPSVNPFSLDIYYHPQSKKDITVLRASDRDSHVNAFLRYEILGGNDKQLFTINPYTGVLSFSRTVYQNDAGSYDLKFIVKDSGIPVLSTVTTLSLTLTVSNKTSKMLTLPDTKSDDKIHINLVIIILLAAVIVSVATVVSITVCIVRRNHQRNTNYRANVNTANKSMSASRQPGYDSEQMTLQYDVPVPVATSFSKNRGSLPSEIYCQPNRERSLPKYFQKTAETSVNERDKETTAKLPYCYSEMSMVSCADSGRAFSEGNLQHYEEQRGIKLVKLEPIQDTGRKSLPQVINQPKESKITTRCSYKTDVGLSTNSKDIIDLKSIRVNNANSKKSRHPWNLPMRNSFTAYSKPLPALPKRREP